MTANDIHDAIETFARYGVPRERILMKSCVRAIWTMYFS